MQEQPEDLEALQALLDRSLAGASDHLQSIVVTERTPSATELVDRVQSMRVLALSTVSAAGRPRISNVDGHFLRGRWVFTTSGTSVKARDMRARPAVSAAYLEGEEFAVWTHGDAEFLEADHPDRSWVEGYLTQHYGQSPSEWGPDIVYLRLEPRWMAAYRTPPE